MVGFYQANKTEFHLTLDLSEELPEKENIFFPLNTTNKYYTLRQGLVCMPIMYH